MNRIDTVYLLVAVGSGVSAFILIVMHLFGELQGGMDMIEDEIRLIEVYLTKYPHNKRHQVATQIRNALVTARSQLYEPQPDLCPECGGRKTIKVKCYTRVCQNIIEVQPHPSGWELCPDCSKMVKDAVERINRPRVIRK